MNVDTKIEEFASLRDGTTLVIQRWLPGPAYRDKIRPRLPSRPLSR